MHIAHIGIAVSVVGVTMVKGYETEKDVRMAVGDTVFKYGVDIGRVVEPIKAGQHAHVHNIKTKRW